MIIQTLTSATKAWALNTHYSGFMVCLYRCRCVQQEIGLFSPRADAIMMKRMTCPSGIPRHWGRFLWFTPSDHTSTLSSRWIQSLDGHYWPYTAKHCYFVLLFFLPSDLPLARSTRWLRRCGSDIRWRGITNWSQRYNPEIQDIRRVIFQLRLFYFWTTYDYISKYPTSLGT